MTIKNLSWYSARTLAIAPFGFSHTVAYVCSSCGWVQERHTEDGCVHCGATQLIALMDRLKRDYETIKARDAQIAALRVQLKACVERKRSVLTPTE